VIENGWLQVTVVASAHTGLAVPDVFYFGNAVGDSGLGDTSVYAIVNANDELAARFNPALLFTNIPITDPYDYNRDGSVNSNDELIDRANATNWADATRYIDLSGSGGPIAASSQPIQSRGRALAPSQPPVACSAREFSSAMVATDRAISLLDNDNLLDALLDSIRSSRFN